MNQQNLADFIWNVADALRGDFKQSEFGRIILPFTVLRRLECVLEPTRDAVLAQYRALKGTSINLDLVLPGVAGATFYNTSTYTLATVGSTSTRANLEDYMARFSANARQIFEHFAFAIWLERLEKTNLLFLVTKKFADIDLHPSVISNHEMGLVFEHLIRKFAESANDTAGEFFTPRDVVRLATVLVFATDEEALRGEGVVRTVYDCAAGTGGFLSSAIEQVEEWNPNAKLIPYAQELNPETYAISVADKLIKGYDTRNIKLGNTLANDLLPHERFDYCLANPPFGVKWEKVQKAVQTEHDDLGYVGRFGAGLPRVGDGSLLFLMHLLSKRKPAAQGGTRIGIVLSGSPLFNGGAGSGESEIRRWILEQDWLEAIVALPTDLFYNTGIGTYVWILSNHKAAHRKGKVQLIDATALHTPMRKSLGSKRKYLSDEQIAAIARLHDAFEETPCSKIYEVADFGYRRITVERPLRLRVRLDERRIHQVRHLPDVQNFMVWMEERFGLDCHERLNVLEPELSEHVRAALGLDPSKSREERQKLEKEAAGILRKLLDQKAWVRRVALSDLIRAFWMRDGASEWEDYNLFEQALRRFAKQQTFPLTAADIKHLRVWVTDKDPACAPVIAEDVPAKAEHEAIFGGFPADGNRTRFYEADPDLREFENVPLKQDIRAYFTREVLPHVPDAWIDETKRDPKDRQVGIVGYEINFNRYFYRYVPPRGLEEIDADLKAVEAEIAALLGEVTE
ncbi:MAG: class I SAM-dependent DNA methyltransferase [Candidatus Contendobacter sp.]|nr:class I SAM-dependent DNA methyltransferase [Candidatus Contendobacter sp.]MDS4059390.1 class I SAM-dependent DNA methyltransferase [Candidatus Contendobacter sp.]